MAIESLVAKVWITNAFNSSAAPGEVRSSSFNLCLVKGTPAFVVGTGQSGTQIAQELYQSGRKVYLSVGSAGREPRRYRGRDILG